MHPDAAQWVADRKLAGIEHKYLGSFGVRRSGARLTRLASGAASWRTVSLRVLAKAVHASSAMHRFRAGATRVGSVGFRPFPYKSMR